MRILEALLLLPDLVVELVLDVVADRVELRQLLRALALADVALAEILERAVFKRAVLPRLLRVDVAQRLRAVNLLAALGDEVRDSVTVLVVDTVEVLEARVRDLLDVLRDLDARREVVVLPDCCELVDGAEDRLRLCRDQALADAERIDAGALLCQERRDGELIEAVRDDNLAVRQARLVEHLAHALREVREVARVDADAHEALAHRLKHLMRDADGIRDARVDDIVRVDEQDRRIRIRHRVLFEGLVLVAIEHDPAVRHRARDRDAEHLAGRARRRADDAADVGSARAVRRRIHIVGAARTEVRDGAARRRLADAARLRRNERLVVNLCEDGRLHELRVNERCDDRQDRLIRIHDRALRQRVDIALEAEILEISEELLREHVLLAEVLDILVRERHVLHILDDLLEPSENGKATLIRILAVEDIERHLDVLVVVLEVTIGHGQFVEVHHHRDIAFIKLCLRQ